MPVMKLAIAMVLFVVLSGAAFAADPKESTIRKSIPFATIAEVKMTGEYDGVTLHQATMKIIAELVIEHGISLAIEMEEEEDAIFQTVKIDLKKGVSVREVLASITKASDCAYLYAEEGDENILRFKRNVTAK